MYHIAVAMPMADDEIRFKTMISVIGLIFRTRHRLHPFGIRGYDTPDNRIRLVRQAQEFGCDKLLFVDSDMEFEEDALNKLLVHEKPIVGANYFTRDPNNYHATAKLMGTDGPTGETTSGAVPTEPFEAFAVGTGLCLIDMAVFHTLPQPWFKTVHDEDGRMVYSDDTWFCKQARAHGFPVWCDPTIHVKHLGEFGY